MIPTIRTALFLAFISVCGISVSNASVLQPRDLDNDGIHDAFYDPDLDVTWYRHLFTGRYMDLVGSVSSLSIGGYGDWRLPRNDLSCQFPVDVEHLASCKGNELLYLFSRYSSPAPWYFYNFYAEDRSPLGDFTPWAFRWSMGSVQVGSTFVHHALAVRDGDVLPTYSCEGFLPPADQAISVKKPNRVLPLRMTLIDGDGMSVWDLAAPVVNVNFAPAIGEPASDHVELTFAGRGDEGNKFFFDGTQWAFNLSTAGFASGDYTITAKPGSADYAIIPTCEVSLTVQ